MSLNVHIGWTQLCVYFSCRSFMLSVNVRWWRPRLFIYTGSWELEWGKL